MKKDTTIDLAIFKVAKGINLPKRENTANPFIPNAEPYKNANKILEKLSIAINENMPVLLMGETGTGKTSVIRYLANNTNNGYRRVNHNGGTTIEDIVGRILVNEKGTYWVDGVLTQAMRAGDWYIADEINASNAEILFVYHSLLDDDGYIVLPENGGEIVKPHPNFRFFATMNPSIDYVGVKELNKALMSRFIAITTEYPTPTVEAQILTSRTGINEAEAKRLIDFAVEIRATKAKEKIQFVLSTRDLLMWARLLKIFKKFIPSGEISVLNKVNSEDIEAVKTAMLLHFKGIDEPAKNEEPAQNNQDKTNEQEKQTA